MSTHSPEPWKVEEYRLDYCNEAEIHIVDAKGSPVFCATQSMYETNIVEAFPEDWRRVVACVNFCRNFPTEELEGEVLRQSDEGHGIEYYPDTAPERKFVE